MNAVKDQVTKLVEVELAAANEKYPAFHSAHEGYAVILEEIQETKDQLRYAEEKLGWVWEYIKANAAGSSRQFVKNLRKHAELIACEAIQVAAMAQKYLDMEK